MGDKPETSSRKKRISIKRVAEEAGVSVAAVSLALSGKGRVSQKRAEEIKKIADRLGFIPNHNASRLRSGESILLGLMVNDISNPFYAELTKDVEEQAYAHDYLSLIANTNDDLERQSALIRAMIGQGVAGLIIVPAAGSTPDTFSLLRDWGMPYVIAVRDIGDQSADFVG
ncbi:MAG: LacI family DNA-binding transcriptional regulator, partial [Rhodomicrobiaceae bacterium]